MLHSRPFNHCIHLLNISGSTALGVHCSAFNPANCTEYTVNLYGPVLRVNSGHNKNGVFLIKHPLKPDFFLFTFLTF